MLSFIRSSIHEENQTHTTPVVDPVPIKVTWMLTQPSSLPPAIPHIEGMDHGPWTLWFARRQMEGIHADGMERRTIMQGLSKGIYVLCICVLVLWPVQRHGRFIHLLQGKHARYIKITLLLWGGTNDALYALFTMHSHCKTVLRLIQAVTPQANSMPPCHLFSSEQCQRLSAYRLN